MITLASVARPGKEVKPHTTVSVLSGADDLINFPLVLVMERLRKNGSGTATGFIAAYRRRAA